ncbi:secreted RxLR effector protein 161-like [Phaseolus vulgaris]|uniref:secreted RxLR effector protein 161-like n=1 Tax=Phaseolus vulgaris TaxID=3885 RepID=UPI0035C9C395
MDPNVKLLPNQGEPLSDPEKYMRSFAVSVVSQFLNSPCEDHWNAVICILKYIKGSPGKGSLSNRRSTFGYCVSIGDNLISWKSKKQSVVAISSAKTKYRAMASATCELVLFKQLLKELQFGEVTQMTLICDN